MKSSPVVLPTPPAGMPLAALPAPARHSWQAGCSKSCSPRPAVFPYSTRSRSPVARDGTPVRPGTRTSAPAPPMTCEPSNGKSRRCRPDQSRSGGDPGRSGRHCWKERGCDTSALFAGAPVKRGLERPLRAVEIGPYDVQYTTTGRFSDLRAVLALDGLPFGVHDILAFLCQFLIKIFVKQL